MEPITGCSLIPSLLQLTVGLKSTFIAKVPHIKLPMEIVWMTLWTTTSPPQKNEQPTLVNRLRDHHTDFEQQARHQSRNRRWIELIPTLHGAFISLRNETENWTTSDAFKDRLSHFCDCQHSKYRYVELVDLCGQRGNSYDFATVHRTPLWLLARGYIGSTPTAPESVFSLHLLGFHDHLWQWCNVGTQPFMKAMEAWLEERSKPPF
ncbi:hypothetical protein Pst134EA_031362 [Puccinia striiformis f. sp. tritici]|uniref:uncharacterized protein n=1 Tax=Puccinia striiformis f. sp. tritici TaxID=168172 RepID=UPI002008BE65|nr:uncharacterized protein Pst134EA_031362 [Puccinia striiformis f. sp. tritici]KAH9445341.1 hypothetical protein Pst134EA_031362 [Puccinia striiformis f. sp. tritici]